MYTKCDHTRIPKAVLSFHKLEMKYKLNYDYNIINNSCY